MFVRMSEELPLGHRQVQPPHQQLSDQNHRDGPVPAGSACRLQALALPGPVDSVGAEDAARRTTTASYMRNLTVLRQSPGTPYRVVTRWRSASSLVKYDFPGAVLQRRHGRGCS